MAAILVLLLLLTTLAGIAVLVCWIWALVDCLTNKRINESTKLLWTLLIIFTSPIGPILYFAIGRNPRGPVLQPPAQVSSTIVYQGYYQSQPVPPMRPMPPMQQPGYSPYPTPPAAQPPYQPYGVGYQPQPAPRRDGPEQLQGQQKPTGYEQYELPHATYPEQQQQ